MQQTECNLPLLHNTCSSIIAVLNYYTYNTLDLCRVGVLNVTRYSHTRVTVKYNALAEV